MLLYLKTFLKYTVFVFCIYCLCSYTIATNLTESKNDSKTSEALFRKLFKLERVEQSAAIKALMNLGTDLKKHRMIEAIADRIFTVIRKSKIILENASYVPGKTSFPNDENIRDALSNVLENTVFLGDIVLRLPELSQKVLANNTEWNKLFKWSLNFSNQTQLIDNKTARVINLVNQEMNYTSRKLDYVNPYKKLKFDQLTEIPQKKKKPKKKLPRGPKLSSRQTGEL